MPRFKRNERGEMPFLDHLEEMRWRLIWSLLALTVGFVIGFVLVDQLNVMGLLTRPIAPQLAGGKLYFTSPIEPFMITLKLAFFVGVVLASPVMIWQLWKFLSPALYEKERRIVLPVSMAAVLLILVYLKVISASFLSHNRRFAIAGNAFLAMVLAPPDLVSMTLMMVPVQLLYEITVVVARIMERRRKRAEAAAGDEAAAPGEV